MPGERLVSILAIGAADLLVVTGIVMAIVLSFFPGVHLLLAVLAAATLHYGYSIEIKSGMSPKVLLFYWTAFALAILSPILR